MAASQALVLAARVCLYVLIGLSFLTWAFGVYGGPPILLPGGCLACWRTG